MKMSVTIVLLLAATSAFSQTCPDLIGTWPFGPTRATAVDGDLAFFSSGPMLMIADVSDPASPRFVGELDLGAVIADIEVSGGYAFITDANGERLIVVDATTPGRPVVASVLMRPENAPPNGGWLEVEVEDEHAYLVDDNTVRIIDVSDRANPFEIGFFALQGYNGIYGYAVSGTMMYVVEIAFGLRVVDVSDPSQPTEVGSIEIPDFWVSWEITYFDDVVLLAEEWDGIRFIDVSDPANPSEVGIFSSGWSADFIEVSGDVAYVASGYTGDLHTVDVSDMSNPIDAGRLSFDGGIHALALSGGSAFVAADAGLFVVDVADPSQPAEVGSYGTAGESQNLHVAGNFAYVAAGPGGLRVVDISNPVSPQEVGSLVPVSHGVSAVTVAGNYAFVLDGGKLRVVDIVDPSQPTEMALMPDAGNTALAVSGDYVYLNSGYYLHVIDVSNPVAPTEVGAVSIPYVGLYGLNGLSVEGDYAFLAKNAVGVVVFDISDPENPAEVDKFELGEDFLAYDLVVSSGKAFIASNSGLLVVDVSSPSDPVLLGSLQSSAWDGFSGVAFWNGLLFALEAPGFSGNGRLIAADVSVPSNPTEVGSYDLESPASKLIVVDGVATVANLAMGLSIFDVSSCGMSPPAAAFSVAPDYPKASEPVSFTDLSSGSPTSWTWDFGDGSGASTEKNPAHTYSSAGSFEVTLTVANSLGTDSTSQWIAVELAGQRIYIPVTGVGAGVGNSLWSSDVVVNNRGDEQISYELQFLAKGQDNTNPRSGGTFTLDSGVSALYEDVLGDVFGMSSATGALCFVSDDLGGAILMSRTKSTDAEGATFGQGIPAVAEDDLIPPGVGARLIGLAESGSLRTNIGFLNASPRNLNLTVKFYADDDSLLGQDQLTLAPYSFDQWNRAFDRVDAGTVENGWVEVISYSGRFFTYASVVDNLKDDPTYILPQPAQGPGATRVFIPASAVGGGVGTSVWSTDVVLHRRGTSNMTYEVTFLPKGVDNSNAQPVGPFDFHSANNGRSVFFQDILAGLFDLASASGALVVDLDYANDGLYDYVLLMSRTKNTDSQGATFGQGIPAVAEENLIPADSRVRLIQLAENNDLRTNIGFMNGTAIPVTLNVEFFNGEGASLGIDTISLQPYSYDQWNRAFNRVGKATVENGYVDVWTATSGGLFYTYGSVIDMYKDDPVYVLPQ